MYARPVPALNAAALLLLQSGAPSSGNMAEPMAVDRQSGAEHTLYVNNLYEKIKQDGKAGLVSLPWPAHCQAVLGSPPGPLQEHACSHSRAATAADLKKCMRCIFGQFGNILDVISRKTYRLRGQAWVVFEKAEDAKKALHAMQGFPFFDKPIVSSSTVKICGAGCGARSHVGSAELQPSRRGVTRVCSA